MSKFSERVYNVDEFTNKEYAELLKLKTEDSLESHKSNSFLAWVLYLITVVLVAVPFFMNIPDWANEIILFVRPITYIATFVLQIIVANKIMMRILGSAFAAGLDTDKPIFDVVIGALYSVLAIVIFIICPPIAIGNQIKKDKLIIMAAEKVLAKPDQIV
jgi:hypothetical protein